MKLRCAAFITATLLVAPAFAATPGIEFSGVLTADGTTRIALTDTASKSTTWVQPGDNFNGYTVSRYDAKEDAIFLKKNGEEIRVGLVASKTPETSNAGRSNGPALSANPSANAIRANLRQLATAARQLQSQRGLASVSYADLVGPGKPIPVLTPVAGENYSTLTFNPQVTAISVTTSSGTTVSLDVPPALPLPAPAAPGATTNSASSPANAVPAAAPAPAPSPSTPTAAAAASATPPPPPAEALPPTGRQPSSPSYTIQGGDTLESIAHSNGVTVQELRELNPTLNGSSLRSGETIRIRK